jgi:hypothetical protein
MDEIRASIKEAVILISPELEADPLLDLVLDEVVDRVLIYTNREQLIRDYEEDVVDYPITNKADTTETYYEFWKNYRSYPIPSSLYKPIARVIVNLIKTYKANLEGREVKSISDLSQSITFGDEAQSYLASLDDAQVFMSIRSLLNKFRIPTIVESTERNETKYL